MRIIILGAGQVGASVAESLASEDNDITLVDLDRDRLAYLQGRMDIRTICGNAATPSVLRAAGADGSRAERDARGDDGRGRHDVTCPRNGARGV